MLKIGLLVLLFGVIAAISRVIGEKKRLHRAKRRLKNFEKFSPPKSNTKV